jgi:hypothetical protein
LLVVVPTVTAMALTISRTIRVVEDHVAVA